MNKSNPTLRKRMMKNAAQAITEWEVWMENDAPGREDLGGKTVARELEDGGAGEGEDGGGDFAKTVAGSEGGGGGAAAARKPDQVKAP